MNDHDTLLGRHAAQIARHQALPIRPRLNTVVLSCLDARTDPAHFLGLEPGDALVLRNAGGRVTPDIEQQLGVLGVLARKVSPEMFGLVIVHHTDCGMERIASDEVAAKVSTASGVSPEYVRALAIHDHAASLREDVERLQSSPMVPRGIHITAVVYDHATGRLQTELEAVTQ